MTEMRILLRTTATKDAIVAVAVLERAGMQALACQSMKDLIAQMDQGVGALIVAEEVLIEEGRAELTQWLRKQPAWSDLPIIVSARPGVDARALGRAFELLSNVTLLERPMRIASLVSAVRSALRARKRQFELREHLATLHEVDRRKTEFLATLAHELRNPMAPLTTTLAILRRKAPLPEGMKPYYDIMARQVDHMVKLVDDLMEVSRITRGKIELTPQRLLVSNVVAESVDASRPGVEARGHTLSVDPIDPMLAVQGDPVRLIQVFSNLLNNAARYTPDGGRIDLTVWEESGSVVVCVRDSGVGIDAGDLLGIFDMFVQVSGTTRASQGGLGIGLTLVKSLVELHGGQVHATSAGLGQGSQFSVKLPLATGRQLPDLSKESDAAEASLRVFEGLTVLVVDDNKDAADSLGDLLTMHGATVQVAYSAAAGLAHFAGFKAKVAVLDIGMPGMDGYELAHALIQRAEGNAPFLIALTGWGQVEDRARIVAAGFDLHLVKPVNLDELARELGSSIA